MGLLGVISDPLNLFLANLLLNGNMLLTSPTNKTYGHLAIKTTLCLL